MPGNASHEWVRRPWWRRWLARLMAVVALGGVAYGVVIIVRDGTGDASSQTTLTPQLTTLAKGQEALARRLEALRPGRSPKRALAALRAAQRDQVAVVTALRERQAAKLPVGHARALEDALGAEFDYLDAVGSLLRNRRSPLLKTLGDRAEAAKDAFTALEDSAGVEDGIRGTTALAQWVRDQR